MKGCKEEDEVGERGGEAVPVSVSTIEPGWRPGDMGEQAINLVNKSDKHASSCWIIVSILLGHKLAS